MTPHSVSQCGVSQCGASQCDASECGGFWHVTGRLVILGILVSLCTTGFASAQALGEVAKKEEERRKTIKTAGKVYTNGNIKPDPNAPATSTPAAASSSGEQSASTPSTPDASSDDRKKDEASWKKRMSDEREALQRAQTFADALQSQVNALNTDYTNRDDPAQRAVIAGKRDRAIAELGRARQEVQARTKAIATIQDEARKAGVPAGWVR
jgi:type II secretory pathway pseudopilin PulG